MATSVSRSSSKAASRSPSRSSTTTTTTSKSSVSSHLAMVDLKNRTLAALSKLSDRDTHQIAAEDLERIILSLPADAVPMLLTSLLHDPAPDPAASVKHPPLLARRESLRLLALLCATHPDPAAPHLQKIISHIVRRLKDPASDSSVRDACRDAAGSLSAVYVRASGGEVVALFVKPMLEAIGDQNKAVQAGAAMCLARVVECAGGGEGGRPPPASTVVSAFQKLCPRICKLLGAHNFLAKGALLSVVASLSQIGAISPQGMQPLLQCIRECLDSSDWATRKAAADTLIVLASHSSKLIIDGATSTIAVLEACRFDKVKPVRESMSEALLSWKKITGKGENGTSLEDPKDGKNSASTGTEQKLDQKTSSVSNSISESAKKSSSVSSPTGSDAIAKGKGSNILEKAAVILKKRAPSLTDKELNPEFFQKLETRCSDDLPVEVVLPRRCLQSSHSNGEETYSTDDDSRVTSHHNGVACRESNDVHVPPNINDQDNEKRVGGYAKLQDTEDSAREKWTGQRGIKARTLDDEDRNDINQKDPSFPRVSNSRTDNHAEGSFINNKGNWLAIQRQLSQLERQQANLMNMLQGFMGGSHDSMVTLENRVRGLERVVEEMARDLALPTGRRGSNMMMGYEVSPGRSSSRYNSLNEYPGMKFGRGNDGRIPFAERFYSPEGIITGARGRDPPWRSDSDAWDSFAYSAPRSGLKSLRRGLGASSADDRLTDHDSDHVGSRRAWEKGQGPFRLGEGPSARSVWQASKDEATLEAIRVAGEDNGTYLSAGRGANRELDAEALVDDNQGHDKGPLWASWTRAMDSLQVGDLDSAYAEVLSTGDDLLLVKLMDRTGPVVDQLSTEIACEVLRAVGQFLLEQSLLDVALPWIQQLIDLVEENGTDFLGIPLEGKREILLNLHEVSAMEQPEDWEGTPPDQLIMLLASAWGINMKHLIK